MFKCECGKEFENSQSFNGHKCHCKIHQLAKYGNLTKLNNAATIRAIERNKTVAENNRKKKLDQWVSEKHVCEHCGKVMTEKYGSGRFCCKACAKARVQTEGLKTKKGDTLRKKYASGLIKPVESSLNTFRHNKAVQDYLANPKYCKICGKQLDYEHRHCVCCSEECKNIAFSEAGKKSAITNANVKRSKNEKYFAELCSNHFKTVLCNKAIFNGWDADIIIEDIKYAILWNGPWHYKTVFIGQNSSLAQIQNRDNIKISEIRKSGYIPYIIKDMGKYNKQFVEEQFNILINNIV